MSMAITCHLFRYLFIFFNGRHRAVCSWNVSLSRLFRWFIFEWKLDPQAVGWTTKFRESFDSKNQKEKRMNEIVFLTKWMSFQSPLNFVLFSDIVFRTILWAKVTYLSYFSKTKKHYGSPNFSNKNSWSKKSTAFPRYVKWVHPDIS